MNIVKINDNIHRILVPYKEIFTTVFTINTPDGVVMFDAASFDEDAENYIFPFLDKMGVTKDNFKYIFISHNHKDHSGTVGHVLAKYPDVTLLSRSEALKEKHSDYKSASPDDGDLILGCLKVVTIVGHTDDSMAILDTRTNTLITGDCLQIYGIYGSEDWGANIRFPVEHIEAINKLRRMDIAEIYTAHEYHPYGTKAIGNEEISRMLDGCIEPLMLVKGLIIDNPSMTDEEVREVYNSKNLPTIRVGVVEGIRKALNNGKI